MQAQQGLRLEIDELVELLAIDPKLSIKTLSNIPVSEVHQTLLDQLIERFPAAAGIISPGSRLKTPAGIAQITMLETQDGQRLTSAHLKDPTIHIHMVVGEGVFMRKFDFGLCKSDFAFCECINRNHLRTLQFCSSKPPGDRSTSSHQSSLSKPENGFLLGSNQG